MIRINLLPTKKKVKIPPILIYGAVATGILALLLTGFTFYINGKISATKTEIAGKEQKLSQLKVKLQEVLNYEKDNEDFRKKTKVIEQLKRNQVAPLRLLDEVSGKLPKGVWLTDISDQAQVITMQGFAHTNYDLVTYVQNLKSSKHFQEVMLVESRQTVLSDITIYKFKLTFIVKS